MRLSCWVWMLSGSVYTCPLCQLISMSSACDMDVPGSVCCIFCGEQRGPHHNTGTGAGVCRQSVLCVILLSAFVSTASVSFMSGLARYGETLSEDGQNRYSTAFPRSWKSCSASDAILFIAAFVGSCSWGNYEVGNSNTAVCQMSTCRVVRPSRQLFRTYDVGEDITGRRPNFRAARSTPMPFEAASWRCCIGNRHAANFYDKPTLCRAYASSDAHFACDSVMPQKCFTWHRCPRRMLGRVLYSACALSAAPHLRRRRAWLGVSRFRRCHTRCCLVRIYWTASLFWRAVKNQGFPHSFRRSVVRLCWTDRTFRCNCR